MNEDEEATYTIIRGYRESYRREVIATGLTLAEAQAHCQDPETSSSTCTTREGIERTMAHGDWFDRYQAE